jgi:3-oxoacyl-[acyl-carrier protein] reductase
MRKSVLITGATGGIGDSICEVLKTEYDLFLLGRNKSKLIEFSKKNSGVKGFFICDLSDPKEIKLTIDKFSKENINIDILVNNAGITDDSLFIRMSEEKWTKVINTNLNSNFLLTNLISKNMIRQKWGRIINITSIVGHTGNFGQSNYSASKAGIIGMSKSIALELAKRNITVNCISPGFIDTSMTDVLTESQKEIIKSKIPMGIIGKPEDVANCVYFLVSEKAKYITGETIHINGGMTML